MTRVWPRIAAAGGARTYALAATLAILVVTARALGPEGRGEFAAAITWATLFSTLGYLSLGQVALHRAGTAEDDRWLGPVLASLVAVTGVVSVLAWAVAAITYAVTDGELYGALPRVVLAAGVAAVPLLVWEQYGSSLLMALDRLSAYNRAQVAGRTVGLVAAVLLLALGWGVPGALLGVLLGQAVVAAAGGRMLHRMAGDMFRWDVATTRQLITGGLKLHLNAVGAFLVAHATVLLVQYYRGAVETGYFQTSLQLLSVALLLPQAATMVLYTAVARDGADGAWPVTRRVLFALTGCMTVAAVVGVLLAPSVVPLVLGESFRPAVPVFQILCATLVGQAMSAVMAPQWIGRGLFWQVSLFTVMTGAAALTAGLLLVPRYGMQGAAWVVVGVYTASVLGNGAFAVWVSRRAARGAAGPAAASSSGRAAVVGP